jgi:FkbM family methyltransferase
MIKRIIRKILLSLNIQTSQTSPLEDENKKKDWLKNMEIKTILDIGANSGQFAREIHQLIPDATLFSFEPLSDCYEQLIDNFQGVKNFKAFNLALGNETGFKEIHRSEYSLSSSLLPMATSHKEAFPFTSNSISQKIEIAKLDDVADQLNLQRPILIKLDVQGFEDSVIKGGRNTISLADIIITELSVEELYEGQKLFDDIYKLITDLGFVYRGNYDQLHDPHDGRVLQCDGIFTKI